MQENSENWFASWFDTPYYHLLYKERNEKEAQLFINNLVHYRFLIVVVTEFWAQTLRPYVANCFPITVALRTPNY